MTNPDQTSNPTLDNELDKIIDNIGGASTLWYQEIISESEWAKSKDRYKQSIKSLLREVELEARIDELNWVKDHHYYSEYSELTKKWHDSICLLKEEVDNRLDNLLGSK